MNGLVNEWREKFKAETREGISGPEGLKEHCQKWGIKEVGWKWISGPVWKWEGIWESEGIRMKIMGGMGELQFLFLNYESDTKDN
jgi:hypothetical protein